jgi:MFS family permease
MGRIPISTIISQWFRRRRGMAMGLTFVGGGLGSFIMPPVFDYLIDGIGWRGAYVVLGGILWVGTIPLAALILRRRPQDIGLLPHGEVSEPEVADENGAEKERARQKKNFERGEGLSLHEATSKPAFWLIAVAFFFPMMSGIGLLTHFVAIFMDMGLSSRTGSMCLGIAGGLSIAGRLGFGFAADRFSVRKVFTVCFVLEAFAVCMLLAMPLLGANSLYAFVLLYGLTGGGGLVLAPLIIGECFGLKSMGTIFGMLAIAAVVGGAIGPVLAGVIFDSTGSYHRAFMIFCACEICAAIAISQVRSPLKPE